MRDEYDFSTAKRAKDVPHLARLQAQNKSRITIMLDNATLDEFRSRAEQTATGYQTLINAALKDYLNNNAEPPITESALRRILKEELPLLTQSDHQGQLSD